MLALNLYDTVSVVIDGKVGEPLSVVSNGRVGGYYLSCVLGLVGRY